MKNKHMYMVTVLVAAALCLSFLSCSQDAPQGAPLRLWYDHPASAASIDQWEGWQNDPEWLKALPIGNGFLGAMVFGGVNKERLQLNEKTLWSGSPDDNDNPDAYAALGTVRQL